MLPSTTMWQDKTLILLVIVQTCKSWTDLTPSVFEQAPAAASDQRGNEHAGERVRPFPAERHHEYGGGNRADRADKVA